MFAQRPTTRALAALTAAALLAAPAGAAQGALTHAAAPAVATPIAWAAPAPADVFTVDRAALRFPEEPGSQTPNFQAPSATSCARPVRTYVEPGGGPLQIGGAGRHARPAPAAVAMAERTVADAAAPAEALPAPPPMPAPPPSGKLAPLARGAAAAPQQAGAPVTAGMVDDNADVAEYLAFRARTDVPHRPREVRGRTLLQVRDPQGRPVPDAEVAVRGSSGGAMWARTDTAGRAWIAPDAFDAGASQRYEVTVRQGVARTTGVLKRGQQSALDIVLDATAPPARARLDLVFLVDATGSMGDEIARLRATLHTIADEVARLPSRPDTCFGLVAYRDRGDAFLLRSHDFTNDLTGFQQVLDQLQADGGGDNPEAMNEALHEAVHALNWRGSGATRLMVLLADAHPHLNYGGPQYDDDMMAALGKGIKIFSVGASGLDPQGEYIQRQIAQYTGGRFVFLTYRDRNRPGSGPGTETVHDVRNYSVDTLDRLIVRLVSEELARLPAATGAQKPL